MISLILLICSESYQAMQAAACLFQSLHVVLVLIFVFLFFLPEKALKLHAFQMRIRRSIYIQIHMYFYYPLTGRKLGFLCF